MAPKDDYPWDKDLPWADEYVDLKARGIPDATLARILTVYPKLVSRSESKPCPTCRGKLRYKTEDPATYELAQQDKKAIEVDCDCSTQYTLGLHYARANISDEYQRLSWNDYKSLDVGAKDKLFLFLRKHQNYFDSGIGLMIQGQPGNGKTYLASQVAKELVKLGVRVFFTSFIALCDEYGDTFGNDDQKHLFLRRYLNAPVLFIDSVEPDYHALGKRTLTKVIDHRKRYGMPIIWTSNSELNRLIAAYGHQIEALRSYFRKVQVKGISYATASGNRRKFWALQGWVRQIY